jgi:hypothetical protein
LSKSTWYPLIASSTASAEDADTIASNVGVLSNSINKLRTQITGAAEFELTTLDELISIKAISKLPEKISDPELLGIVERYELNALEERLRRRRDIFILESELAGLVQMRTAPIRIFDKAALIVKTCDPLPILKSPAKYCLSTVREWLELLPTALEVFQSLAPAYQILQVPSDFEASGIESIALCVILASDLKEQQRQWLANGIVVDEARFAKFDAQRSQIAQRDAEWRRQFISYRYSPWPSAEELREAAKLLRQGLLGKLLSTVVSKTRKAAQLTKTLGFTRDSLGAAETVERLANHVQQFEDFWRSPEHVDLFGAHWQGSETSFDEIRFGVRYREFLRVDVHFRREPAF